MKFNPDIHHRRSIRLKDYDYSSNGVYFSTICTNNKECLLGEIADGKCELNDAGIMIFKWLNKLEDKFSDFRLIKYVIMPNHIHFVIFQTKTDFIGNITLGSIVQWFKTMTTNEYIKNVAKYAWKPFNYKLWQRNYYEHIIRNEAELQRVIEYISDNPIKWELDEENPKNLRT